MGTGDISHRGGPLPPRMYFDPASEEAKDILAEELADYARAVDEGEYNLSGYWMVSEENLNALQETNAPILASYAGFILDGGRIVDWVTVNPGGGDRRVVVYEPFTDEEKEKYLGTYWRPRPGGPSQVLLPPEYKADVRRLDAPAVGVFSSPFETSDKMAVLLTQESYDRWASSETGPFFEDEEGLRVGSRVRFEALTRPPEGDHAGAYEATDWQEVE